MLTVFKRIVTALVGGGLAYLCWMVTFLLTADRLGESLELLLWLLAPVVTAAGYTAGILIFDRLTAGEWTTFLPVYIWPLAGCAIGAGAVFWIGPMLIVFGMFVAGTVGVILREYYLWYRPAKAGDPR